ncbi:restriction endonuclease subunit S [Ferroacidibacillus organovorans]|uniref:restriction endonuclease subunit S n=1 Tax=Ferroacidibacillus organovorans TaxID=1765683 RepID=UPI0009E9DB55
MSSGVINFNDCDFISEEDHEICKKRVKPEVGDVLLANIGSVGDVARVTSEQEFSIKNVALLRPNPSQVNSLFFYYITRSSEFKKGILNLRLGSAQPYISLENLRSFRIQIPVDKSKQYEIANVLRQYDNLIANNRRRIELLEQAARLLYKEWFVHFRFPGHELVKIVDGVPDGWSRVTLVNLCHDIRVSIDPSSVPSETPYIGLEHIPRRSITLSEWGHSREVASNKFTFKAGDILFGKIRPYFHKVGFALVDGITSSDAIVVRSVESKLQQYCLTLLSSDEFVSLASKTVREGSKMPRADWNYLQKCKFLRPADKTLEEFNLIIEPMVEQMRTLALQSRRLAEARDLLLPRLMNGEIAI